MNSLQSYSRIVFFTGAGMSAESGVPTYRGKGGIWDQYDYQDVACQKAFEKYPEKVLAYHEMRRNLLLSCHPHAGHAVLTAIENQHPEVIIVTQNIDGMHQRAGSRNVIEIHGSIWRMRCPVHGIFEDMGETYRHYTCPHCDAWLRPDITWFDDAMNEQVMKRADDVVSHCNLFVSIGTSAIIWPAAGFPELARDYGAWCVEINPEATKLSSLYHETIRLPASEALQQHPFMASR
ncbi:MAG: NAD-dependent deacylase [Deltaproteobacteria bacterium]|nr:NAD-dependent deacylase [Deltaproteobacteria bacterium]